MSEDEMREKALASARTTLGGKTELERSVILHQHLGSRVMSDMVIETFQPSAGLHRSDSPWSDTRLTPDELTDCVFLSGAEDGKEDLKSTDDVNGEDKDQTDVSVTPDSPSKQLPDQISFFSGNPSVEIVHGIMHLYKTKLVLSIYPSVCLSSYPSICLSIFLSLQFV